MHVHDVRDFPQAKLDSEINDCFLLNKHLKVPFIALNWSIIHNVLTSGKKKITAKNVYQKDFLSTLMQYVHLCQEKHIKLFL